MKINKKGFTLIELLVVIAIIGLLSTLAVVSLNSARAKARDARRQSDLKQISTAMELYMSEQEDYPDNLVAPEVCGDPGVIAEADAVGALENVCGAGSAIEDVDGNTFLTSLPEDPGNTTVYQYEGDTTTYCMQATLETADTAYFVCTNGSCYGTDTPCTAS